MSASKSVSSDERRGRKRKDISGQRFGRLTALYPTGEKKRDVYVWHCVCDCGKEKDVSITSLTGSSTTSCGCARKGIHKKDITGQTFGSLTAIAPTDKMARECTVWKCRCVCGNEIEIPINYLIYGTVKSCGCQSKRGHRAKDLTGQSFGRVTALYPTDKRLFHSVVWRCRCVCGNEIEASVNQLKRGTVKICECMRKKSKVSR